MDLELPAYANALPIAFQILDIEYLREKHVREKGHWMLVGTNIAAFEETYGGILTFTKHVAIYIAERAKDFYKPERRITHPIVNIAFQPRVCFRI